MSESLLGPQIEEQATEQTKETQSTEESTTEQTPVKPEETKVEESKEEKTEEKKESAAPENYEFSVPEGLELDTVLIEKVTPVFKELNLTQEQAQKLVAIQTEHVKEQVKQWEDKKAKDKEDTLKMLGPKHAEELSHASRFINQIAGEKAESIKSKLEWTGLGNDPEIVEFFIKAGKMLAEDKLVEGKPTTPPKSTAKVLYPDNA